MIIYSVPMRSGRRITARRLFTMAPIPVARRFRNWLLQCLEDHYLLCADVEAKKSREALENVSYYQKRAVLTRSARIS